MKALPLELFSRAGVRTANAFEDAPKESVRACDWPELDQLLPGGGLPQAVVELVAQTGFYAGVTSIAVASVRAAQKRDARAWCAWIDTEHSLYAPGLLRAGVDLSRLFVVRPKAEIARVAIKVASSGAFDVVVVDASRIAPVRFASLDRFVRKLALAAEEHGASIVLLAGPHTGQSHRSEGARPWPVALRLEVTRTQDGLDVRITKERHGRLALAKAHVPISLGALVQAG